MKPEKALELVGCYARLTKQIKDCKKRIGASLELCNGISGKRNEFVDGMFLRQRETDGKNRELDVHLTRWYTPEWQGDYGEQPVYDKLGEWSAEECPHCYAAHLAIQERKEARINLGRVKSSITKGGAGISDTAD